QPLSRIGGRPSQDGDVARPRATHRCSADHRRPRRPRRRRVPLGRPVAALGATTVPGGARHGVIGPRRGGRVAGGIVTLVEAGPFDALLDDPLVEEIWINAPDRVFVSRGGLHELTSIALGARQIEELVERLLQSSGRRLDRSVPFVDARLHDGSRLHVVIPPITGEHWSVNIRRFVGLPRLSLDELVTAGSLSRPAARFLDAAVRAGLGIVVAGPVGAGKTTLLNCLAASIP